MKRKYSYIVKVRKNKPEKPKTEVCSSLEDIENSKSDLDFDDFLNNDSDSFQPNVKEGYDCKVICRCGHCFTDNKLLEYIDFINFDEQGECLSTKCPSCNDEVDFYSSIKLQNSYSKYNVFRKKYYVFNEKNKVKIVLFEEFIQYNKKGKMFLKKYRQSITYNKQSNRFFYVKNKGSVIGISNRNASTLSEFFEPARFVNNKICNIISNKQTVFRNYELDVVNPLNEFFNSVFKDVNKKDADRLSNYVELLDYDKFIITDEFMNNDFKTLDDISNIHNDLIRDYVHNLLISISVVQYPYLSNILFLKGKDFYLKIIVYRYCPNKSYLEKYNPTSPHDILTTFFLHSIHNDLMLLKWEVKNLASNYDDKYSKFVLNKKSIKNIMIDIFNNSENSKKLDSSVILLEHIEKLQLLKQKIKELNLSLNKKTFNDIENAKNLFYIFNIYISNIFSEKEISILLSKFNVNDFYEIYSRISANRGVFYDTFYVLTNKSKIVKEDFNLLIKKISLIIKLKNNKSIESLKTFDGITFSDTFRFLDELKVSDEKKYLKKIFSIKNMSELNTIHDELYKKISTQRDEKIKKEIKEFFKKYDILNNITVDGVKFKLINSLEKLNHEGNYMNHCVYSYAKRLSKGMHLIFSLECLEINERATLEFYNQRDGKDVWVFNQLKGRFNKKTSEHIVKAVINFCKKEFSKNDITYSLDVNHRDLMKEDEKSNATFEII